MARLPSFAISFGIVLISYTVLVQTAISCDTASDCTNVTIATASKNVECVNNSCVCNSCFEADMTGKCTLTRCYTYGLALDQCTSTAPRWIAVLLMTILVGGTGAANFYIKRYEFAIPQLLLFCLILIMPCVICCVYCCTGCDCGDKCRLCGLIINLLLAILLLIANLSLLSWWIADLVIFSLNMRTDGDGCKLDM